MPVARPSRRLLSGLAVLGLAGLLGLPAVAAEASLGSVPVVVSDYVTDGALKARLQQLYGPGAKGAGVDFDSTTKTGAISRVWEWTDDRYAHPATAHPIQLTNYWTVPITIASQPVGVAAVWINPGDDAPELAQFTAAPALATALADVPADAAVVHDSASAAWFAVAGATANPLISGRSGVTTATPVADLKLTRASAAPAASGDPNTGIGVAIGVLALLVIVIVVAVVVPARLRRPQAVPQAEDLTATTQGPVESDEPAEEHPEPEPVPEVVTEAQGAEARAAAKPKSATATKAAAGRGATPVSQKPASSRPRTTAPRATSTKPAASKPPASKPPARKPRPPRPAEGDDPAA